jgi:outer membrane lipoprotein SlyB
MSFHGYSWLLVLFCTAAQLNADTVTLQNGRRVEGTFLGGNTRQIDFLTTSGESLRIQIDTLKTLTFASATPAAPGAPAKSSPPAARHAVLIPAGTVFRVHTIDAIDVDATQAGMKFRSSLDDPIMSGGSVVVPRGADVVLVAAKVAQGGRTKGSDLIQLKANSLKVNGRVYPVVTSVIETKSAGEGKKTARKAIGGSGLGAIIGGIAGGGKGAAIGAAAGAAGGMALAASGQPHLKIPPETRLEFKLLSDWKVQ